MPHLVSYDISSDKARIKAARHLLAEGFVRAQKSVFVSDLAPAHGTPALRAWLEQHIEPKTDLFLIAYLTERQLQSMIVSGAENLELNFIINPPNTLIL